MGVPSRQVYGYPREGCRITTWLEEGVPGRCTVIPWGVRFTTWKEVGVGDIVGYHPVRCTVNPVRGVELPPVWMNGGTRRCTGSPWGVRITTWK